MNSLYRRAHCKRTLTPERERFCSHGHTVMTAASGRGRSTSKSVLTWQVNETLGSSGISASHSLGSPFPLLDCLRTCQHHQLHVIPSLLVLLLFKFSLETGTCLVFKCQRQLPNSPEIMTNGQCLFNISLVTGLRLAPHLLFLF